MSRTAMMTIGFLFIFVGIQLNLVESYTLTPRMTNFLSDQFSNDQAIANPAYAQQSQGFPNAPNQAYANSPYQQASYSGANNNFNQVGAISQPRFLDSGGFQSRVITPPRWICWPVIFLGAVIFLNGATMRR